MPPHRFFLPFLGSLLLGAGCCLWYLFAPASPQTPPIPVDDHLTLRMVAVADAPVLSKLAYFNRYYWGREMPGILLNFGVPSEGVRTIRYAQKAWKEFHKQLKKGDWPVMPGRVGHWVVCYEGEVIGMIGLHDSANHPAHVYLDYCLSSLWIGQGIMSRARQALFNYLFTAYPALQAIDAEVEISNTASRRVMDKSGAEYLGATTGVKKQLFKKIDKRILFRGLPQVTFQKRGQGDTLAESIEVDAWIQGHKVASVMLKSVDAVGLAVELKMEKDLTESELLSLYVHLFHYLSGLPSSASKLYIANYRKPSQKVLEHLSTYFTYSDCKYRFSRSYWESLQKK